MVATVYSAAMWWDSAAILAIMREDNLDAQVATGETELDCLGLVNKTVKRMATGCEPQGVTIKADDVIAQIAEVGYGNMTADDWKHLVEFRLPLSTAQGDMLCDCLFQVCNGRVTTRAKTYSDVANLHPKKYPWPKAFLLMETYCSELLSEEHGQHKAMSHNGPQANQVKALDPKAISLLAQEKTCWRM